MARQYTNETPVPKGSQANQKAQNPQKDPTNDAPNLGDDEKALKAHQEFESVAGALTTLNNQRLGSLVNSIISERQASVSQACDVLEAVEDGRFDLMLMAQELQSRRDKRVQAPHEFKIESKPFDIGVDLDQSIDCVSLISRFSEFKAIAGV